MTYESLFVDAGGRTSRGDFAPALAILVAAAAFYYFLVHPSISYWILLVLLFPAFALHARRLHDMGHSAWLLLVPGGLLAAALWLHARPGADALEAAMTWGGAAALCGFALWGLVGRGKANADRFGGRAA